MIKKILLSISGTLVFASISTSTFASTITTKVQDTNGFVFKNCLTSQSKSMSDTSIIDIGALDHKIRITTSYCKDSEGVLYMDVSFDKLKGDSVPERFRPYEIFLTLDSVRKHEITNITLRSGAMSLAINRLWYETEDAQTYNVKLDCTFTDSEGNNNYSFNGVIATFIN